jgi:hypothetical protein
MAISTAKYVLKSDRSKSVEVISPVHGIATILGTDGKKTEMERDEFMGLYEPQLQPARLSDVAARPDASAGALEKIQAQLVALSGRVNQIGDKVDAIHAVAVVPKDSNSEQR